MFSHLLRLREEMKYNSFHFFLRWFLQTSEANQRCSQQKQVRLVQNAQVQEENAEPASDCEWYYGDRLLL